jgi:hypothetical protein
LQVNSFIHPFIVIQYKALCNFTVYWNVAEYDYHTVGAFQESNRKFIKRGKICICFSLKINNLQKRGKIDTPNPQIKDRSLFELGTVTLIKSGGVKLVLLALSRKHMHKAIELRSILL